MSVLSLTLRLARELVITVAMRLDNSFHTRRIFYMKFLLASLNIKRAENIPNYIVYNQ